MRRRRKGALALALLLLPSGCAAPLPPAWPPHSTPDGHVCVTAADTGASGPTLYTQMVNGAGQCCDVCEAQAISNSGKPCVAGVLNPGPYPGEDYYACDLKGPGSAAEPAVNATLVTFVLPPAHADDAPEDAPGDAPPPAGPAPAPARLLPLWVAVAGVGGVATAAAAYKAALVVGVRRDSDEGLARQRMGRACACPVMANLRVSAEMMGAEGGQLDGEDEGGGDGGRDPLLRQTLQLPPGGGDAVRVWPHSHLTNAEKKLIVERASRELGEAGPQISFGDKVPPGWTHDPYPPEAVAAVTAAVLQAARSAVVGDGDAEVCESVQLTDEGAFFHFRPGLHLSRGEKYLVLERYRRKVPRGQRGRLVCLVDQPFRDAQAAGATTADQAWSESIAG